MRARTWAGEVFVCMHNLIGGDAFLCKFSFIFYVFRIRRDLPLNNTIWALLEYVVNLEAETRVIREEDRAVRNGLEGVDVGDGAWSVLGNLVAMWAPSQTAEEYAIVQLNATGSITLAAGATYRLVFQFVSSTNTSGFIALASETYQQGSFVMAGVDSTGWDAVFTTYMGL